MDYYTPLFSKIVESSLWDEPDYVVKVFLTLLAVKDSDWVVRRNSYNLAFLTRKSQDEVEKALKILQGPDRNRKEQPDDGRRIRRVEDGWLIINGPYYQGQMQKINRRIQNAKRQQKHREKVQKTGKSQAQVEAEAKDREKRFIEAENNGDGQLADAIAAEGLPQKCK